jgi:hypothetical protein
MRPLGCQSSAAKGLKSLLNGLKGHWNCVARSLIFFAIGVNFCPKLPADGLVHVPPIEKVGPDKGIQIAIENLLHIAAFNLGAMVLD